VTETRWTPEQERAISLRGCNILVSAAAGAGKTSVLVERVIRHVLNPSAPLDLERLLAVTFTEKAAAEMKQRVRASLEEAFAKSPGDPWISRQRSLLDRAQISTIHSFCLHVVKRYFYKAGLDPSFRVLDENEAELLRQDALSELFEALYQDEGEYGDAFRAVVDRYGGRRVDEALQATVLRLHDFARNQASMNEWLGAAMGAGSETPGRDAAGGATAGGLASDEGAIWTSPWMGCIIAAAAKDIGRALSRAEESLRISCEPDGPGAYREAVQSDVAFYRSVANALQPPAPGESAAVYAERLTATVQAVRSFSFTQLPGRVDKKCDPAKSELAKGLRDQGKKAFGKVAKYAFTRPAADLAREIAETAVFMRSLVRVARDLDRRYSGKKLDRGGLDFSDLERYCLDILERDDCQVARDLRKEFDCVLVDEYQDTSPLQERILSLVSSQEAEAGNRFMVGDLKQSIYRFRLAEPHIFLDKFRRYRKDPGEGIRVDLSHNFRSRQEVISAANHVFKQVMREDVAEIEYGEDHELRMGASYPQAGDDSYEAELHLVERVEPEPEAPGETGETGETGEGGESQDAGQAGDAGAGDKVEEFEALEKEALVVASRINTLVDPKCPLMLWDPKTKISRPCSFRDIAILMRSTKDRANAVLEVLQRCDIPAYADTGTGYFQAREVEIALSLLSVIDNPRQDIPLAAVLRSPIVGLAPADLARIRASHKREEFYDAVRAFAREVAPSRQAGGREGLLSLGEQAASGQAGRVTASEENNRRRIAASLTEFLEDLDRWRTMARRRPLAEVLWTILRETGYQDYVGGLPGGAQRQANLRALCDRAREFDSYGRHGLFRFLRFIEKIQDTKGDLGTARALGEHEDVVRVMSVHKAKGLEFQVVFVMDLGKQFNMDDLRQDVLFHRDLGIGGMHCDLEHRVKYPTALHQAISLRLREEDLAEEMRVLYVALTRAKEKLVMVGSARELSKRLDRWTRTDPGSAITCLDWVCPALLGSEDAPVQVRFWGTPDGEAIPLPSPRVAGEKDLAWRDVKDLVPPALSRPEVYEEVRRRLEWQYPNAALTTTFGKMSVGELRRRLEGEEEEAQRFGTEPEERFAVRAGIAAGASTAAFAAAAGPVGTVEVRRSASGTVRGIAVHTLLAKMRLDRLETLEGIREEADRLQKLGFIEPPGVGEEDIRRVSEFFATPLGQTLRSASQKVRREVPFTMKVPAALFEEAGGTGTSDTSVGSSSVSSSSAADSGKTGLASATDFVVVQGVIDLLIDEGDGLIVLDYKTDDVPESGLDARFASYLPQISLYALAAARILRRPVKRASIVFLHHNRTFDAAWREYLRVRGFDV